MSGECIDDTVSNSDNEIDDVAAATVISWYLSPRIGASSVANGGTASKMESSCEYIE